MTAGLANRTDEDVLRQYLEQAVPSILDPQPSILNPQSSTLDPRSHPLPGVAAVASICRRRFDRAASYDCQIVTARLTSGAEVELFLKDFGVSRLPKDALDDRRQREVCVYRDLLAGAGLGTARYHGSVWDVAAGRFWLFLERVDGRQLRDCVPLEDWLAAGRWLGRLHGYFARHPQRLRGCDFLVRHDADFFRGKAELAVKAVAPVSAPLAGRLAALLAGYDRVAAVLAGQPPTLVHGSFRPENILVTGAPGRPTVCPVDWELAALGSALYDLAFLMDNFKQPKQDRLWEVYREEAGNHPLTLPGREEARYLVNCFRLVKVLKSLGESREKNYPAHTVAKLVGVAEGLGRLVLADS